MTEPIGSARRKNIGSGGPWEETVGYSRAVKVGPHVYVAGTTAMTPDGFVGEGDAYAQAVQALKTIGAALAQAGAGLEHVVRTRMFVTAMEHWDAVARAHGEVFRESRPAATLVGVTRLVDPRMLVEIEAEAYLPQEP